jgi:hypothetical protein
LSLSVTVRILEHFFERHAEHPRDLKGHFQGRRIAALFDGDDGLPMTTNDWPMCSPSR